MTASKSIKARLDYSVFIGAALVFMLSILVQVRQDSNDLS
ncbi:hypothetical protein ABIB30_000788 [Pedobacter sp. UYP1]